jgi:hypothetical protein
MEIGLELRAEVVEEGAEVVDLALQRRYDLVDIVLREILSRVQSKDVFTALHEWRNVVPSNWYNAALEQSLLATAIVSRIVPVTILLVQQRFATMYKVSDILERIKVYGHPAYHCDLHGICEHPRLTPLLRLSFGGNCDTVNREVCLNISPGAK